MKTILVIAAAFAGLFVAWRLLFLRNPSRQINADDQLISLPPMVLSFTCVESCQAKN